ncbi:MAG TPA: hypothetical protein PKY77_19830 [Phycisphaerae bacterium]|nr:hypothetical protein [Phycisphaerae bacterium]HRY69458.1 hypothetical protein [Phycisphaerae bacterium]HSA26325.1 hypothetical protein [Phycisphaerae bacterium]
MLCCLPAVEIIFRQVDEMVPGLEAAVPWMAKYADRIPPGVIANALARRPEVSAVRRAFEDVSLRGGTPSTLDSCRRSDADNGLYDFLDLLVLLRSGQGGDAALLAGLSKVTSAPPVRLYVLRQRQVVEEALGREGVSRRRAAVVAWESCTWLQQSHDRVFRELARLLLGRASAWRETGCAADAVRAHAALVRLATDVAEDSPSPGTVLLASELTASGCRELARDAAAVGVGSGPAGGTSDRPLPLVMDARRGDAEGLKAAALGDVWHEVVDREGVGMLPWMGASMHVLLARSEHHRVMVSLVSSVLALACYLTLLVVLVLVGASTVATRMPPGVELKWPGGRWGCWCAAALPVLPLLAMWVYLSLADIDFSWLLSAPSVVGVALFPALTVILLGVAAYLSAGVVEEERRWGWSLKGGGVVGVVSLLTLVLVRGIVSGDAPWRPPLWVREFRAAGLVLSLFCLLSVASWILVSVLRYRRGRFSLAVLSRALLPVVAASFLYAGVLSFSLLWLNEARNTAHQQAFARAAADPVTGQLGPDWYRDHLAGARALIEALENR